MNHCKPKKDSSKPKTTTLITCRISRAQDFSLRNMDPCLIAPAPTSTPTPGSTSSQSQQRYRISVRNLRLDLIITLILCILLPSSISAQYYHGIQEQNSRFSRNHNIPYNRHNFYQRNVANPNPHPHYHEMMSMSSKPIPIPISGPMSMSGSMSGSQQQPMENNPRNSISLQQNPEEKRRLELAGRDREARRGVILQDEIFAPFESKRLPFLTSQFNNYENPNPSPITTTIASKFISSPHQPTDDNNVNNSWKGLDRSTSIQNKDIKIKTDRKIKLYDIITESKARKQFSLKNKKSKNMDLNNINSSSNNSSNYPNPSIQIHKSSKSNQKGFFQKGVPKIKIHKTNNIIISSKKKSTGNKFSSSYKNKSNIKINDQNKINKNDSSHNDNVGSGNLTVLEIIRNNNNDKLDQLSSDSNLQPIKTKLEISLKTNENSTKSQTPLRKEAKRLKYMDKDKDNNIIRDNKAMSVKKDISSSPKKESNSTANIMHRMKNPSPTIFNDNFTPISITIPIVNPTLDPNFYQKVKSSNESFYDHYTSLMNMSNHNHNQDQNNQTSELIVTPISLVLSENGNDDDEDDDDNLEDNMIESTSLPKFSEVSTPFEILTKNVFNSPMTTMSSMVPFNINNGFPQFQPQQFTNLEARSVKYPNYNNYNIYNQRPYQYQHQYPQFRMTENPRAFYPSVSPIQNYPSPSHMPPPPPPPYRRNHRIFPPYRPETARMSSQQRGSSWLNFKIKDEESNESNKDDRHGLPIVDPHHPAVQNALHPLGNPAKEPEEHILKKTKIIDPQSLVPLDKTIVICTILFGWLVFFAALFSYHVWGKGPQGKGMGANEKLGLKPLLLNIPQDGTDPFFASRALDVTPGSRWNFSKVLEYIDIARKTYEGFDWYNLECQKRAICELSQKDTWGGETGRKLTNNYLLTIMDALDGIPIPQMIQAYLTEYKEAISQGKNSNKQCGDVYRKCTFSIKEVIAAAAKKKDL